MRSTNSRWSKKTSGKVNQPCGHGLAVVEARPARRPDVIETLIERDGEGLARRRCQAPASEGRISSARLLRRSIPATVRSCSSRPSPIRPITSTSTSRRVLRQRHGLHTARVVGLGPRPSPRWQKGYDFQELLTLFSPRSKEKALLLPEVPDEIDMLIATDCISEGQNLQDCDYLVNYDIHWNPVRIIQRFGRIDRIGSKNASIQLVNYWPDISLDEYIRLKERVESRMVIADVTATGDDNPLDGRAQRHCLPQGAAPPAAGGGHRAGGRARPASPSPTSA